MKLYELGAAPSARRVSLFLAEKRIDIPRVHVDIRGGQNLTDDFKGKSINGRIPMLELDDGITISESMAICRYLDAAFPTDHHLFGSTPIEIGQVEMWNRIAEFQGLFTAFQAFRNITGIYSDRERCVEAWGHESKERVKEFLPTLEKRLSASPYLAGEHFSVADITAYVMVSFIKNMDIHIDESLPAISAWYKSLLEREAFIEAQPK
ncbi:MULTISPECIES: glutathione S-transferase [Grimontia]|uniref:Glutathionine S-transferase n=1 Tax=Grimontia marina TaxID=646534 RepID=A0A128FBT1_9GAMM|nr:MULTISPECIES: glutathione S-transferase [Grimontia]WRV99983.1 glutathione S-transferase [Grimontia sp. NTOU-MAR1]CZF84262.1 glutathionine S-transferase [Grimontia marina]